jgi:molybdopterin-guanine dinucleotide biosynthesis protein A
LIAGAVLAGGKSLRFGKNKAFQQFKGKRFVDLAIESLRPFCDPVMLVVSEIEPYLGTEVTLVQDIIPHLGPLGGLYTALLFSPVKWVFAKATDMPFLVPELASLIIDVKEDYDAVVPKINDFYEPLFALYNRGCLPVIANQLKGPDKHKITDIYRKIRIRAVTQAEWSKVDPDGLSFKNVNTPTDLAGIDGLERG